MQSKVYVCVCVCFAVLRAVIDEKKARRKWTNDTERIYTFSWLLTEGQIHTQYNRSMNYFCIFYWMAHELLLPLLPSRNVTLFDSMWQRTLIVYIWNISSIGFALGTLLRCIWMYILFVFTNHDDSKAI